MDPESSQNINPESDLCVACQSCLQTEAGSKTYQLSKEQFVKNVEQGCLMCTRLWYAVVRREQAVQELGGVEVFDFWANLRLPEQDERGLDGVLNYKIEWPDATASGSKRALHSYDYKYLSFDVRPVDLNRVDPGGILASPGRILHRNTASIDCSQWINDCDANHQCLARAQTEKYVPPRLLHLSKDHVRLVETSRFSSTQNRYATLSHCWGTEESPLCLGVENYDALTSGVSLDQLPLTFRDAVDASLRLGVVWLWIDSVCICQTGPEHEADWNKHVTEMANIYANAYVNLAASRSTGPSQGCYVDRDSGYRKPITIQRGPQTFEVVAKATEHMRDWKLNKRAWVLQERLLSPRTIHFGATDVFFECSESLVCANQPQGLNNVIRARVGLFEQLKIEWPPFNWQAPGQKTDAERSQAILQHWRSISIWYSRCELSYPSDRLPALAGIAKAFSQGYLKKYPDAYLAGFFTPQLPGDLLWSFNGDTDHSVPKYPYFVAPSWSWLSRPHEINLRTVDGTRQTIRTVAWVASQTAELVDSDNPFGALKAASLLLNGAVARYRLQEPSKEAKLYRTVSNNCKLRYSGRFWDSGVRLDILLDDLRPSSALDLTLLGIKEEAETYQNIAYRQLRGLVLRSAGDAYERVGTFDINYDDEFSEPDPDAGQTLEFQGQQILLI